MRVFIGLGIVVISVIFFGWWGLLSLIITLPFIGWKDRHKGPFPTKQRWSVCYSFRGNVKYELTHDSPGVLVGFVMFRFFRHQDPNAEWEVHLVFNKEDTAIKLDSKYFPNEDRPIKELYTLMGTLDGSFMEYGNPNDDPVFFSREPFRIIPLSAPHGSFKEMVENPDYVEPTTFSNIMDEIFGIDE